MSLVQFFLSLLVVSQIPPDVTGPKECPGSGDCCEFTGTPGCNNLGCCNLVCAARPACCDIGWDPECVTLAGTLCDDLCLAEGCPGAGSCCTIHVSAGCSDPDCCDAVCTAEPNCCAIGWSTSCITLARALCGDLCDTVPGCPGMGACCRVHGSSGCNDPECCATVCSHDAFCCRGEWDDICARTANDFCGAADGTYCEWCPSDGSCCTAHGTPGCDKAACCQAVCAANSFCCSTFWTGTCATQAAELCVASVCVCDEFGDLNSDGELDMLDVASYFLCFTGADAGPIDEECACADDNGDGDVDLEDYGLFGPLLTDE